MQIIVKTLMGLEDVLASEIRELGGRQIKKLRRAVSCEGDKELVYKLNYLLRTGLSVLVAIDEFKAHNYTDIYNEAMKIDWTTYLGVHQTFIIRCNAHSDFFKNTQYALQRLKDAISDHFVKKFNKRPSVAKEHPDIYINLRIFDRTIFLHSDSSGEALFKRGYIKKRGIAPLNEVLAAGLLRLSGWKPAINFYDPMCGSGTFLLEAISAAYNIPSQYHRKHWGFMNWKDFDLRLWKTVVNQHKPKAQILDTRFYSSDISLLALNNLEQNIAESKIEVPLQAWRADFFKIYLGANPGFMFINPPYNQRISLDDAKAWYMRLGKIIKQRYKGWKICIISADIDSIKHVGLRPDTKIHIQTGGNPAICYLISIFE